MTKVTDDIISGIAQSITSLKFELIQILPNFIHGLLIILIGIIFAYLLKWSSSLIVRWGIRLFPKKLVQKELVKNNITGLIIGTGRVLFFVTLFLSLATGFKKMGLHIVSEWMERLGRYLPNIIGALLILFVGWKLKEFLAEMILKTLNRADFVYSQVTSQVISWSIFVISLLVSLEQIGVDMSLILMVVTVLLGVAAFGIALTLALGSKSTISDILYCYQLHKYLKVGQDIRVAQVKGTIKSIGPIFVSVETSEGDVTIPGSLFNHEIAFLMEKGANF